MVQDTWPQVATAVSGAGEYESLLHTLAWLWVFSFVIRSIPMSMPEHYHIVLIHRTFGRSSLPIPSLPHREKAFAFFDR